MKNPNATYQMSFDGNILQRGFWLYIWKIESDKGTYLYVGRTGDSSSSHASSPFNRIGQHLNFKKNAKGNSIAKQLMGEDVKPENCQFSMIAFGPLENEIEDDFEAHKPIRDMMATYEFELATFLKKQGYHVLGTHHPKGEIDLALFEGIKEKALTFLCQE